MPPRHSKKGTQVLSRRSNLTNNHMKISLRAPNFTKITGNTTKALPDAYTTLKKRSSIAPKGSQEGLIRLHEAFKTTASPKSRSSTHRFPLPCTCSAHLVSCELSAIPDSQFAMSTSEFARPEGPQIYTQKIGFAS